MRRFAYKHFGKKRVVIKDQIKKRLIKKPHFTSFNKKKGGEPLWNGTKTAKV